MDKPLLSAIIPTHDRPEKLAALLSALAGQTVPAPRLQVLVADDGVRHPVRLSQELAQRGLSVKVVPCGGEGPARARNRLLPLARAPLTLFLNDDVVPEPDLCAQHLAAHERLGTRHSVFGTFWFPEDLRQRSRLNRSVEDAGLYGNRRWRSDRYVPYWCAWTPNLSVATEEVRTVGGFDGRFREAMVEDVDLGLRLERAGVRCFYTSRPVAWHDHELDLDGWMSRNHRIGHNRFLLFEKMGEPVLLADHDPQSWPDPGLARSGLARLTRNADAIDDVRELIARLLTVRSERMPGAPRCSSSIGRRLERLRTVQDALAAALGIVGRYDYSRGLLEAAAEQAPLPADAPHDDADPSVPSASLRVERLPLSATSPAFARRFDDALRSATADLCLVHDPSAEVSENALRSLLAHLEAHPRTAMVVPLLGYAQGDDAGGGSRRASLRRQAASLRAQRAGRSEPVAQVLPPCLLIRRAPVLAAGGLHARYQQASYALRDLLVKLAALGHDARVALDVLVTVDLADGRIVPDAEALSTAHDRELFLRRWVRRAR